MGERRSVDVEWVLDAQASSEEIAAVTQIALEEGLPGHVRADYSQKSIEDVPWVIFIMVSASFFLTGFFEEAGRHSYIDLRRLVLRLSAARQKEHGRVQLLDRPSGTTIVFAPDLPEEAYKLLAELGLANIGGKYWVWDPAERYWKYQSLRGE